MTISQSEAAKAEQEAKRRLLATRRLSLVVDLDQTVIHATVDPTVAEWQKDEDNPNHAAVKHVRSFQLIDDGPGARGCWYYIKLRPGLEEFLQNISKLYELHIYTMGTRAYAQNIVKIIDPDSRLFGDRVLSRDESGSLVSKTLHRLFPVDTKMVVIIDDRGDVWSWSDNLIKVPAYDFFIGIGDINSSFLPKRTELGGDDTNEVTPPQPADEVKANEVDDGLPAEKEEKESTEVKAPETTAEPVVNPATEPLTDADVSTLEKQLVAMSGGDDRGVLQQQNQDQEEVIAAQVSDRPLAQKQLLLQKADAEAGQDGKGTEAEQPKHRNLLHDDDSALEGTEACLRRVHQAFFKQYESRLQERSKGEEAKPSLLEDASLVPDVKEIMPAMKHEVLANVSIVFTGMVPLGVNIHQ